MAMAHRGHGRTSHLVVIAVVLVAFVFVLLRLAASVAEPPRTQQEVETHLGREVLFYTVWNDDPYVVVDTGGKIRFDRLWLDWISIEWPPTPRWQWTGWWSSAPVTADPASATLSVYSTPLGNVVFGQINADYIVEIEVVAGAKAYRYPVSSPGYAVRLPEDHDKVVECRFLDARGQVVWSVVPGWGSSGPGAQAVGHADVP